MTMLALFPPPHRFHQCIFIGGYFEAVTLRSSVMMLLRRTYKLLSLRQIALRHDSACFSAAADAEVRCFHVLCVLVFFWCFRFYYCMHTLAYMLTTLMLCIWTEHCSLCVWQVILAEARRWIEWDPNPSMRAEVTDLIDSNDLETLRLKFGLVSLSSLRKSCKKKK